MFLKCKLIYRYKRKVFLWITYDKGAEDFQFKYEGAVALVIQWSVLIWQGKSISLTAIQHCLSTSLLGTAGPNLHNMLRYACFSCGKNLPTYLTGKEMNLIFIHSWYNKVIIAIAAYLGL